MQVILLLNLFWFLKNILKNIVWIEYEIYKQTLMNKNITYNTQKV